MLHFLFLLACLNIVLERGNEGGATKSSYSVSYFMSVFFIFKNEVSQKITNIYVLKSYPSMDFVLLAPMLLTLFSENKNIFKKYIFKVIVAEIFLYISFSSNYLECLFVCNLEYMSRNAFTSVEIGQVLASFENDVSLRLQWFITHAFRKLIKYFPYGMICCLKQT